MRQKLSFDIGNYISVLCCQIVLRPCYNTFETVVYSIVFHTARVNRVVEGNTIFDTQRVQTAGHTRNPKVSLYLFFKSYEFTKEPS